MTMGFSTGPAAAKSPFRIVVLGPFAGSADAPAALHRVDGSSFDTTLARLGGTLTLTGPVPRSLRFENLKALRPEGIARQLPGGAARLAARGILLDLRARRLGLDEAIAALKSAGLDAGLTDRIVAALTSTSVAPAASAAAAPAVRPAEAPSTPAPARADDDDPLGGLLSMVDVPGDSSDASTEAPPARPAPPSPDPTSSALSAVIGALAGSPKGAAAPSSGVAAALGILDGEISSGVRSVLDHPDFRRFESAWRGLRFLVGRVDFREGITIEIAAVKPDGVDEALRKIALDKAAGSLGDPISLLVGIEAQALDAEGLAGLSEAARTAATIGAPFVTIADFEAANALAGTAEWADFRTQPSAQFLGIAINRFLLRLPYGADTEPVKDFPFEEGAAQYTWGSPALAVAAAAARSQAQHGWPTLFEGRDGAIEDLAVRPTEAGQLPTEHLVGPDQARAFVEKGFIALSAAPERDVAFIAGAPSAAQGRSIPYTLAERRLVAVVEHVLDQSVGASTEELERLIRKRLGGLDFTLQVVPAAGWGDGAARLVMHCRPGPPILASPENMELQFLL
jgi:hypothetical protein